MAVAGAANRGVGIAKIYSRLSITIL